MTTTDYEQTTLGEHDLLVLISKQPMSLEERVRARRSLPLHLAGRVVVVDGESFDVQVVRCGQHTDDITAALDVLRDAGWKVGEDTGFGHLTGPFLAHTYNDPAARGYRATTVRQPWQELT